MSILLGCVEDVAAWVCGYLPAAAAAVVVPVLVFGAVLLVDPPSVLVLGFAAPMLVLLLAVIGRRTAEATRRREEELGWLTSLYLDLIAGIPTLRGFGREDDAVEVIRESSRRFGDTTMEVLRSAFQTSLVMEWAATAATALVAVQVSFRLVTGRLGFGTALAVLVLTPEFFVPLRRLAIEYHTGRAATAAGERIQGVLGVDDDQDRARPPEGLDLRPSISPAVHTVGSSRSCTSSASRGASLELRDVWLTLDGERDAVLRGVTMSMDPGEIVALSGGSGAGKSSIARLLLALHSPDSGEVQLDGMVLGATDPATWRRRVAWVPQSPTVFAGTLAHNISLGEPEASRSRVEAAVDDAGLRDLVDSLPEGIDTVLGEGARTLSGGERQRLAIARAMLRDAPLVVFDEFTAHLDPATERLVRESATRLIEGRSALVIAHRPATSTMAHRVVRIAHGRILPDLHPDVTGPDVVDARTRTTPTEATR